MKRGNRLKDKIIVVGGYGQVGSVICHELGRRYPGKVYAAGRHLDRAVHFSKLTKGKVLPLHFDVKEPTTDDFFKDVALVIMCLDLQKVDFVQACVDHEVNYLDITADYSIISKIETLRPKRSTIVLSVGLAPGLTNLLTKLGTERLDYVEEADIHILLGLGEAHGRAAIEWTINQLNSTYTVIERGIEKKVTGFSDGKHVLFPGGLGTRTTYRFNFSDQHVLPSTLGISSISTRLCFDSAFMTHVVAGLRRIGIIRWLEHPKIRKKVVDLLCKIKWGSEVYAVSIVATGILDGRLTRYQGSIRGTREFYATGRVATFAANQLYSNPQAPGVFHMEQLFQPMDVLKALEDMMTFEEKITDIHEK